MIKKTVTDYYDEIAQEYDELFYISKRAYSPLQERQKLMLDLMDEEAFIQTSKVLDIGCGPGEMLLEIAERGFETWGIDISNEMIALARNKIGKKYKNIYLGVGDIENLPFDDDFF